ncbi:MAG TPA: phosphatidylcholine/phosphatidylserine synthase [Patescibacteria group bacterium]|nr:phosphatidylcholine/phosphatidylserine synthase [Patescibacteria group bacterium]
MKNDKPVRVKKLSLHKMIPNMITLGAMACGMTSIRFAMDGKWQLAVLAIVVAAFMDAFDGAAARLLKASSKLGAELDSFADFMNFGVAPALVVYLWTLDTLPRWGWPVALVFAMSVALRLAKFNILTDDKDPNDPLTKYFVGVPSPLGGGLCLLPIILGFLADDRSDFESAGLKYLRDPQLIAVWLVVVAGMMVSNFPTLSTKQFRIPVRMKMPLLAACAVFVAFLINEPWPTLTMMAVVYLLSLPFGIVHYNRKARSLAKGEKDPDDADDE